MSGISYFFAFSGRGIGHISNIHISYGYLGNPGLRWSFPLFKIPHRNIHFFCCKIKKYLACFDLAGLVENLIYGNDNAHFTTASEFFDNTTYILKNIIFTHGWGTVVQTFSINVYLKMYLNHETNVLWRIDRTKSKIDEKNIFLG